MSRRLVLLLVGGLVFFAMAGCGDDGDVVTTADISKAEFIKQAEAVCRRGGEQFQEDFAAYARQQTDLKNPSQADYEEFVKTVFMPSAEQEVEDIRAIGAPSGDEERVEAMLVAREDGLEEIESHPDKVTDEGTFAEATRLAKEFGLSACDNRF